MKRFALALALGVLLPGAAAAALVTGVVVDRDGKPVEYANVSVPARRTGAVCDAEGRFRLELEAGTVVLEVSQMGFRPHTVSVDVAASGSALRITLEPEPVPVSEVVVAASAYGKAGAREGAVLRRMEVYTTPGGAADVFQSLRALPGVNAPSEGAAIFVRGGDPRETSVRLDGSDLGHPYHYEGASGGLFSAFDAYMLKSAFFSSGGFSARYGGALSGVLDIETQDPLGLRTVTMGANLAGASMSSSWALVPEKLSVVGTLRFSDVALLDQLYGSSARYYSVPESKDGAGRLLYRYSSTGRVSLLGLASADRVGVESERLNFAGEYRQESTNRFAAFQLRDVIAGAVAVRAQASRQAYVTRWNYGPIAMEERERRVLASLDALWPSSGRHEWAFGASIDRPEDDLVGQTPADSTDFHPGARTREIRTHARVTAGAFYLEDKLRLFGPLYATLGGRFEHVSISGAWSADPRAALAWRLDEHQTLRVAAGRYRQLPDAGYLDPRFGNPSLERLRADHLIAGYQAAAGDLEFRAEAYHKEYRGLVVNDSSTYFSNGGTGYARGVDLFLRGAYRRVNGWVSYGYLDSKRKEMDDPRELPSAYGVPHSLTLVGLYQPPAGWRLGARYSHSSGRPYTPVVGRRYDASRDLWRPEFGENRSGRLPAYHRLDVRIMKLFSLDAGLGLPASSVCVAYVELMNALGTANVLDWVYNADYTERRPVESYFARRMAVAGFSLTW